MKHQLSKTGMEFLSQPASRSVLKSVRPKNDGMPSIEMLFESWEISFLQRNHSPRIGKVATFVKDM